MADNPNANYDTLLDNKKIAFPAIYEMAMSRLAQEHEFPLALQSKLKSKRDFGLEKYGERAFQASIENAIASPVAAHLGDELVDAFNYALHGYYVANMALDDQLCKAYEKVINALLDVLSALEEVRAHISNVDEKEALQWIE